MNELALHGHRCRLHVEMPDVFKGSGVYPGCPELLRRGLEDMRKFQAWGEVRFKLTWLVVSHIARLCNMQDLGCYTMRN